MLRKENETLKSAQEQQLRENLKPDSSEPNQQNNHSSSPKDTTANSKGKILFCWREIWIFKHSELCLLANILV